MLVKDDDNGERPAGKPGECFYCHKPIGQMHERDCVITRRTIVVKLEVEMVVTVPRGWDREAIDFHFNESSACLSNLVEQLAEEESQAEDGCCFTCHRAHVSYEREAAQEDHDNLVPPKAKPYEPEVTIDVGDVPVLGSE